MCPNMKPFLAPSARISMKMRWLERWKMIWWRCQVLAVRDHATGVADGYVSFWKSFISLRNQQPIDLHQVWQFFLTFRECWKLKGCTRQSFFRAMSYESRQQTFLQCATWFDESLAGSWLGRGWSWLSFLDHVSKLSDQLVQLRLFGWKFPITWVVGWDRGDQRALPWRVGSIRGTSEVQMELL